MERNAAMISRKIPWKLVVGIIAFVALIAALRLLPLRTWLEAFNTWVIDLGVIGYILFVAVYMMSAVFFVPGSVLTLGAGFAFGVVRGSVVVSIGATLGAALAFIVARYLAREKIEAKLSEHAKFKLIDSAIGDEGSKLVLLLRLSPVFPYVWLNYLLGLTAVKFWPYVLASWIGMIPGTVLYVYLGYAGKAGLEAVSGGGKTSLEYIFLGIGFIITVFVTVFVTAIARKALKKSALENIPETTD